MTINYSSETFAKIYPLDLLTSSILKEQKRSLLCQKLHEFAMFFSKTSFFFKKPFNFHHKITRPNRQPPTQHDQEHVFCWLNLLAPTLTTLNRHQPPTISQPPTQPLLGIKSLEPTCTVIQLRIQIRQTFEASCCPGFPGEKNRSVTVAVVAPLRWFFWCRGLPLFGRK